MTILLASGQNIISFLSNQAPRPLSSPSPRQLHPNATTLHTHTATTHKDDGPRTRLPPQLRYLRSEEHEARIQAIKDKYAREVTDDELDHIGARQSAPDSVVVIGVVGSKKESCWLKGLVHV